MKCSMALLVCFFLSFVPCTPAQSLSYVLQADANFRDKASAVAGFQKNGRDVLVLDEYFQSDEPYTKADLAAIRSGHPGRKVLGYLSIGEAEDYRPYWQRTWKAKPPGFLLGENPEWKGNFRVRYWNPDWQSIILESLDRILATGFDGVYLDIVDAFEGFEYDPGSGRWRDELVNPESGHTYREDMVAWVRRLAEHAREKTPEFWIVPQNASQLLEDPGYSGLINAIGIEDLFTDGKRALSPESSRDRLGFLKPFLGGGKPVFVIEYATGGKAREHAVREARANRFSLLITDRSLRLLGEAFPPRDSASGGKE